MAIYILGKRQSSALQMSVYLLSIADGNLKGGKENADHFSNKIFYKIMFIQVNLIHLSRSKATTLIIKAFENMHKQETYCISIRNLSHSSSLSISHFLYT